MADSAAMRSPVLLAASDLGAIVVFVTIGLLSHHRGVTLAGYARDVLPLAAGWFGAGTLFHALRDSRLVPLLETWACGITAGVLLRALVLGHRLNGGEAAFLAVCLATIGALVALGRVTLLLAGRVGVRA
jgi:Protein of unknown function (DUF3054)